MTDDPRTEGDKVCSCKHDLRDGRNPYCPGGDICCCSPDVIAGVGALHPEEHLPESRLDYEFSVWPREQVFPSALYDTFRNGAWHGRQVRTFTEAEWIEFRDDMDRAHFTLREVQTSSPAEPAERDPDGLDLKCAQCGLPGLQGPTGLCGSCWSAAPLPTEAGDVEAAVAVMRLAMGDECTVDEIRAYAARLIAAGWTPPS